MRDVLVRKLEDAVFVLSLKFSVQNTITRIDLQIQTNQYTEASSSSLLVVRDPFSVDLPTSLISECAQ